MKNKNSATSLTNGAIIAAIYVILTLLSNMLSLSSGALQLRLSEALCILPAFTFTAVPGLAIGCFISNLLCGCALFDVIFGSLATLVGAAGTFLVRKWNMPKYVYVLPPIISNSVILPVMLKYVYALGGSVWYFFFTVLSGEVLCCGVVGMLLYNTLEKYKNVLF